MPFSASEINNALRALSPIYETDQDLLRFIFNQHKMLPSLLGSHETIIAIANLFLPEKGEVLLKLPDGTSHMQGRVSSLDEIKALGFILRTIKALEPNEQVVTR